MPPETPPWRVKNPWRTPSIAARLEPQTIILSGVTIEAAAQQLNLSEGRRRGKSAACKREHLEQNSHRARIGQPCGSRHDRLPLIGPRLAKQSVEPRFEPELEQEFALRYRAIRGEPECRGGSLKLGEIA